MHSRGFSPNGNFHLAAALSSRGPAGAGWGNLIAHGFLLLDGCWCGCSPVLDAGQHPAKVVPAPGGLCREEAGSVQMCGDVGCDGRGTAML